MSYIDTLRHENCGWLAGLPLNHLLEESTDSLEFLAGPQHLVLGGGSGEHPAAVLHPVTCALSALGRLLIRELEAREADAALGPMDFTIEAVEALEEDLLQLASPTDWSQWGGLCWVRFVEVARSSAHLTPLGEDYSPEVWAEEAVGEFVLVSYPSLLPEEVRAKHEVLLQQVGRLLGHSPISGNVLQLPRGYAYGGRGARLGDPDMRR